MVTKLKYGNTNTYFIRGEKGGILLDTDYAGTLPMFYKEIKQNGIALKDITYILATHYHPDHRAPHKYHTQLHKERKDLIWKTLSTRTMMKYMTTSVTN